MKRLLQKLGCFILILLLIKMAFVVFYGDTFLYQRPRAVSIARQIKLREDRLPEEGINTVFIGSSRTALGISPTYFDSLTHNKTSSYNLGIIGATPSYTLDWCLRLIQTRPSIKYVFFELGGEFDEPVNYDNWLQTFFKPAVVQQNTKADLNLRFQLQNIPLEDFLNKKDNPPSENTSFEELQQKRELNLKIEQEDSSAFVSSAPTRSDLWNKISEIIKQAESRQIRVFFFIPPRFSSENEMEVVASVYYRLESKYKFKVAHYDESLYQVDVSLDPGHINYKGAKRFTELMAQSFNEYDF